jgi:chromate reductase, NAD(P)H dehydrogenase (quinone)
MPRVAVIVGSLRKGSFTRSIAEAAVALAPAGLSFDFVEIGDLELYNQDLDPDQPPASWQRFRKAVNATEAVLFVTPEYNRSVPGVLKNALDVGSRPYGKSVWDTKPAAVISVSPSPLGAFGANHHLRQSLVFLNMPILQQPEAYIGSVKGLLDEQGKLTNQDTEKFLRTFVGAFAAWIAKTAAK